MAKSRPVPKRAGASVGEVTMTPRGTNTARSTSSKGNSKEVSKGKRLFSKVTAEVFDEGKPLTVNMAKELVGWEQLPDLPKAPKGDPAEWEGTGGQAKTVRKTIIKDGKKITTYEPAKPINSRTKDWQGKGNPDASTAGERRSAAKETPMLIDLFGKRIALRGNDTNRPFRMGLAKRYMNEILRKAWKLNGETIILDWFGKVHNGQHTLVGLILAAQAWQLDKERVKAGVANGKPRKHGLEESGAAAEAWSKIWKDQPVLHKVVVKGIDPACADTIDQGQKRTLGDVFYRDSRFQVGRDRKTRKKLNDILAKATRLVWMRSGGMLVTSAPHFPISEAIAFADDHEGLVESVKVIYAMEEDGDGRNISNYLSVGYAAGLHYLMSTCKTDPDEYLDKGVSALDMSMEPKATKFWDAFSSKNEIPKDKVLGRVTSLLRQKLVKIDAGSGTARDEIVGTCIKAFNAWLDGDDKVTMADIEVSKIEDDLVEGRMVLDEEPRLGGVDTKRDEEPEEPAPKVKKGKTKKGKSSVGEVKGGRPKPKRGGSVEAEVKPSKRDVPTSKTGNMAGDKWAEGDTCWVLEKDEEPWFGEINTVSDDGKKAYVTNQADGKEWEVKYSELSVVHPDA